MKCSHFFVVLGILFFSGVGFSQNRWEAQFRPGLNFATEDFAGSSIKPGYGFEIIAAYHIFPQLGIYAGWGWQEFRTEEAFGMENPDLQERGYSFGLQLKYPSRNPNLLYFFQAGAVYNRLKVDNLSGELIGDTGHVFGWQAGAGIEVGIGGDVSLRPSLRYRTVGRKLEVGNWVHNAHLSYISIGVGLLKSF